MKKISSLASVVLFLCFALYHLQSCSSISVQEEIVSPSLQASILVQGDYETDDPGCFGIVDYDISYEILDGSEFLGHDLAVRVLSGPPSNLGDCDCDSLAYCITLDFPQQQVEEAGFKDEAPPHQGTIAFPNGSGSYIDHTDPRGQAPSTHVICASQDSTELVYFDVDPVFPVGYDLRSAVLKVEGICIVGNLEDTDLDKDRSE